MGLLGATAGAVAAKKLRSGAKRQTRVQHWGSPSRAQPAPIPPHPPRPHDRAQRHLLRSARPVGPREPQSARGCGAHKLPGGLSDQGRDFPLLCPATPVAAFHRGAGPGLGAGRRAGAALFPASPEASLALRWEPSRRWRWTRIRWYRGEETGPGGGGGDRGRNQCLGPNRSTPPQPLPRSRAADSTPIAYSRHLGLHGEGDAARPELERRSYLLPKLLGRGFSCRQEPRRTGGTRGLESAGRSR